MSNLLSGDSSRYKKHVNEFLCAAGTAASYNMNVCMTGTYAASAAAEYYYKPNSTSKGPVMIEKIILSMTDAAAIVSVASFGTAVGLTTGSYLKLVNDNGVLATITGILKTSSDIAANFNAINIPINTTSFSLMEAEIDFGNQPFPVRYDADKNERLQFIVADNLLAFSEMTIRVQGFSTDLD